MLVDVFTDGEDDEWHHVQCLEPNLEGALRRGFSDEREIDEVDTFFQVVFIVYNVPHEIFVCSFMEKLTFNNKSSQFGHDGHRDLPDGPVLKRCEDEESNEEGIDAVRQGDVADQIVVGAVLKPVVHTPDTLLCPGSHLLVQVQTLIEKLWRGC